MEFLKKNKNIVVCLLAVIIIFTLYVIYNGGLVDNDFVVTVGFDSENITLSKDAIITSFTGEKGEAKLVEFNDTYNVKLNGKKDKEYTFTVKDGDKEYTFTYSFNKKDSTINFNLKK